MSGTHSYLLPNDLRLLVEPNPDVASAALSLLVPAGSIYEPAGCNGASTVLADLVTRGAGDRHSRELAAALDDLGLQRNESVGWNFISFSAAAVADKLLAALPLYADILLRPHLPDAEFPAARDGVQQGLLAMEDEPQRRALIELRRRCYDDPWGRPTEGDLRELPNITAETVRDMHQRCFRPDGTIIGIAGNVDPEQVFQTVSALWGAWQRGPGPVHLERRHHGPAIDHIHHDSMQTHLALAYECVPYGHDDYYAAWAALDILGGGSSSRLFTEVRERRGLCYSVYATLNSLKDEGRVLAYAGTTAERAQETLDVTLAEINRLSEGIDTSELDRCKARAKSTLIMQQESTMARAGAIARDWFHVERVVPLEEIRTRIESLQVPQILDYLQRHPPRDLSVVTIGPQPLDVVWPPKSAPHE